MTGASPPPTVVRLGTATPGGGFPLYGAAMADVVGAVDPSLRIEPRHTKGSTENVPLLEAGEIDIGLVQGEVAYESLAGITRPPARLWIIAAMYSTAGLFIVRGDQPARTLDDLRGKRVAFGARGSGLVLLARYVLDGCGLSQERDFEPVYLDSAGQGPAMVMDGSVAALWGGGVGWPGFTAVARGPSGARFVAPDATLRARILHRHPFLKPLTLPAGSYPGQDAPIESVGSWSVVMARQNLPDDTAYRLARALHRGEAQFAARLDQARETRAENTALAAPNPDQIHPGVQRLLREL